MNFPLCALLLSWCGHSWHSCHIPISEFNILLNGRSCKIETTAGENWTKNPALLTLEKTLVLKFHDLISKTGLPKPIVKLMFSKKATKIEKIFTVYLTSCSKCQIDGEDLVNFWGLLRKHKLYQTFLLI